MNIEGKYGFIDTSGSLVIPAKYQQVSDFSDGLALVWENELYGYIDATGKTIIPPKFERAFDFSEGLARILAGDRYGFINKSGEVVIGPRYDDASDFCGGLASVKAGELWGFIRPDGTYAIPPRFTDVFLSLGFQDAVAMFLPTDAVRAADLAPVCTGASWGYIDKNGNMVIAAEYLSADPFSDGLASVQTLDGTWRIIDQTGKTVFTSGTGLGPFSEGLARVNPQGAMSGGTWGYVDTLGRTVIEPQFTIAFPFTEGLAPVCYGDKWGFISRSGEMVIPAVFDQAGNFFGGLAWVVVGDQESYVDQSGRLLWPINGFEY